MPEIKHLCTGKNWARHKNYELDYELVDYELGQQLEHVSLRRQFWEHFSLLYCPVLTDILHVTVQALATTFCVVIA